MRKKTIINILVVLAIPFFLNSCLKEKAGEINDEELITTMKLSFTPVGGGTPLIYFFDDPDGPGGVAPVIDTIKLAANKGYNLSLMLLNNSALPPVDITTEIEAEAEAHQFYFETTGVPVSITSLSVDGNGNPVGLTSTWTTSAIGTGTAQITLRHYAATPPDKKAADLVNNPKSSTDTEVVFPLKV
jgi:hypothetical protein